MPASDVQNLALLAELDRLIDRLRQLTADAPDWQAADRCRRLLKRLLERAEGIRLRFEAPLVVANLGGTGTGKSTLVNALLGGEVVATGRQRPTTTRPTLICRADLSPRELGIPPAEVDIVHHESALLRDLVLIDCPDPDTSEPGPEGEANRASNLAALRTILPHCDVLLVTATQQKYRSARVEDELAQATRGCRVIFVQTHADVDDDIREDWQAIIDASRPDEALGRERDAGEAATGRRAADDQVAGPDTRPGDAHGGGKTSGPVRIFRVDSLSALRDAREGMRPRGEFGRLVDLLERELHGVAGARIRRENFLDLLGETLDACRAELDAAMPAVEELREALREQRRKLTAALADRMQRELIDGRRAWEQRLLGRAAARWGFSPFALLLRLYQSLGALLGGALLMRARSPAQLALFGAMEGARAVGRGRAQRRAEGAAERAVAGTIAGEPLRAAAIVLEGYADEAGLPRALAAADRLASDAREAGAAMVGRVGAELDALIDRLARRHTGWFTRLRYELLLLAMLGVLFYRLAKNFFWDSWLAAEFTQVAAAEIYGVEFYLVALFWLALWCVLLLWMFTLRLRRGMRREVGGLAAGWTEAEADDERAEPMFGALDQTCAAAAHFRADVERLRGEVDRLRAHVRGP